jgi:RNA polymerase sigma-70 factor (ECF subfamily)
LGGCLHAMNAGMEAETIWRAQRGDAASLEQIYASHRRRVYGICLRMVRNPSDAEDLMQETFIQVIRKIHAFRGESAFSTWLYRVTKNVVLMRLRKKRPWVASLEEVLQEGVDSDHQLLQLAVNYSLFSPEIRWLELERAIEKLPPVHQRVLVLHDVLGYQHRTIGRMIGLTESNSKSQLRRARMRLGRMLGQTDGGKNRCSNAVKRASAERK